MDDDPNQPPAHREEVKNALAGTLVSSLHRLKDTDNKDGAFFIFGDVSVKLEGFFKLQFNLYESRDKAVEYIKSITSERFQVHPAKNWPGMTESTVLTRTFSDQGVRLRLRKEPRFRLGPKGPASDDYQPRHYNTTRRRQSRSATSQQMPQLAVPPQDQASVGAISRPAQIEQGGLGLVPASSQSSSLTASDTRKREYSYPGSYAGPLNEPSSKRIRQEEDETQQVYSQTQQYAPAAPQTQGFSYGGRQYQDLFQGQHFQMYPQSQQPYQAFTPTYMASPQSRISRDQSYLSPRRAESFNSSSPFLSPTSRLPQTTQVQRSSGNSTSYQYNQPIQSSTHYPTYGIQPQSPYVQVMQPMASNRPPSNLGMYSQQDPALDPSLVPRTSNLLGSQSEMQPPVYYERASSEIQNAPAQQMGSGNALYMGQRTESIQDVVGYRAYDSLPGASNIGRAEEDVPPRSR